MSVYTIYDYLDDAVPDYEGTLAVDPQDVMVAYGTFPGETKLDSKTLNHLVSVNF